MMGWVDIVILVIVGLSTVISLWRGFIRELFSTLAWIAAIVLAMLYAREAALWLPEIGVNETLGLVIAFLALFIGVLLLGGLLSFLLTRAVQRTGLDGPDRFFGALFGALRGALVVALLVLLAGMTPITEDPAWRRSSLLPVFEGMARYLVSHLPAEVGEEFESDS